MRIIFVSPYFYPHVGGVEKHVEELATRLAKRGNQILVVTKRVSGAPIKDEFNGLNIVRLGFPKFKVLGLLAIWWWMIKNQKTFKHSDVTHIHDVFIWYLPLRFLFWNKPVYTTFHGWETRYPIPKRFIFLRSISELLSSGNICVGDYLRNWFGTRATVTIYGGVDLHNYRATVGGVYKYDMAFIGRLEKDTGLLNFLKALKLLGRKKRVVFVGDGSLRSEAQNYGIVTGFVDDTAFYLKKARFVFASGYLSILEAFASKKLVFTTYDNPVRRDYLKMAPFGKWMVIESSDKKLAEQILYYTNHSQSSQEKISQAYNWVQHQTWDNMVEIYQSLWGKT